MGSVSNPPPQKKKKLQFSSKRSYLNFPYIIILLKRNLLHHLGLRDKNPITSPSPSCPLSRLSSLNFFHSYTDSFISSCIYNNFYKRTSPNLFASSSRPSPNSHISPIYTQHIDYPLCTHRLLALVSLPEISNGTDMFYSQVADSNFSSCVARPELHSMSRNQGQLVTHRFPWISAPHFFPLLYCLFL